jgi:hypothetical protein
MKALFKYLLAPLVALLSACSGSPWNSPYPAADAGKNILYSAFAERPKHLDPVQSYSSNEILLTAQIYEPPLQYHYLKRPYTLIPATVAKMPVAQYFDKNGAQLPDDVDAAQIAYSIYEISIRPGIRYQPHPAFAKNEQGQFLYHDLTAGDLAEVYKLGDFSRTGTRELTAEDYVFEIKRLAHPRLHSPILGLMSDYIIGLKEYSATLREVPEAQAGQHGGEPYMD